MSTMSSGAFYKIVSRYVVSKTVNNKRMKVYSQAILRDKLSSYLMVSE
jgi:hypothetical protein